MLAYKNLLSTQPSHHCQHPDCLKAAPFLQLISGEGALLGLVLPTAASIRCLRAHSIESHLAALLACYPRRIFMQRLHSSGLCVHQALLTAREGGTAQGIHFITTEQNMPGTNQSQVLSSSSWKEQSLPVTALSYPAPPQLLGWKGSHSLC